jgi:hypothetical protein
MRDWPHASCQPGVATNPGAAARPCYERWRQRRRALFSAADAALGSAKDSGRNQVGLPPTEEMVMKSCY